MKRIIGNRLWDEDFMNSIESRSFDVKDQVTGEVKTYRETLLREYVLKEGHDLADTWIKGSYGRRVVKENCDLKKGQFLLKVNQGYGDGIFVLLTDDEARAWFERWCPDQVDRYVEIFGEPENPWTGDGTVRLVEQAESRLSSMKWDKERAEENLKKAEAELAAVKAKASKADSLEAELARLKAKADEANAPETEPLPF